jgi:hypothetical protein
MSIKFKVLKQSLQPFNKMMKAIAKIGASEDIQFDMRITLMTVGDKQQLAMEVSRKEIYGVVNVDIEIEEGLGTFAMVNSSLFQNLPENFSPDQPIEIQITDRIYIKYPDSPQMSDIKFESEFSETPGSFIVRQHGEPRFQMTSTATDYFGKLIEGAAAFVYKRSQAQAVSVVNVCVDATNKVKIESSTTQEIFLSNFVFDGVTNLTGDAFNLMLPPSVWQIGINLVEGQDLYIMSDRNNVTFVSGGIMISHSLMSHEEFPDLEAIINSFMVIDRCNFSGVIDPVRLREKLKYIESIGVARKNDEPSFVLSPKNGASQVKLKGFASSGSSVISDRSILNLTWNNEDHEVLLPIRCMNAVLQMAPQFGIDQFFDRITEATSVVFFTDPDRRIMILLSQVNEEQ